MALLFLPVVLLLSLACGPNRPDWVLGQALTPRPRPALRPNIPIVRMSGHHRPGHRWGSRSSLSPKRHCPGAAKGNIWRGLVTLRKTKTNSKGKPKRQSLPNLSQSSVTGKSIYWPGIDANDGPLKYYGGPVITGPTSVHLLFYGAWDPKDAYVITNLVQSFSDASQDANGATVRKWWQIMANMKDGKGTSVTQQVSLGRVVFWGQEYDKTLNDVQNGKGDDILGLVNAAISAGLMPASSDDMFMVLTSSDIKVGNSDWEYSGGFCDQYCGYHFYGQSGATQIHYGFAGSPTQCADGCTGLKGPNAGPGDMVASVVAHELAEIASDPTLAAWYSSGYGQENADLCAWVYTDNGKSTKDAGVASNMIGVNGYPYLLQTLPDVGTQKCVLQAP